MTYFPIVKIPPRIERIESAHPPIPADPIAPQKPEPKPQKVNATFVAIEVVVATVIIAIAARITSVAGWLTILIALGAIALQIGWQINSYPARLQKHRERLARYSKNMKNYRLKQQQRDREIQKIRSPEVVAEFRYNLLLEALRQTSPHDGTRSTATKNPQEAIFEKYLSRYFPGNIRTRLTLTIPTFPHPYSPDIAYIDEELNLFIDIEIDEPYVYHTGAATHFVGASKDSKRDRFFNDKGWFVIRLSEEQVVRYPDSCCKAIAQVIARITGNDSILNRFSNITDLEPQQQWTEGEALEMARTKNRNTYL